MRIRPETRADAAPIADLLTAAFRDAPHSDGTEAAIVAALRAAGALSVSLVAEDGGEIVGYVATSPITIDGTACGWFGLGPLAVRATRRCRGLGSALVLEALDRMGRDGAAGCTVLGDPAFYGRFGFACDPDLVLPGVPAAVFQRLVLGGDPAFGTVAYHPAFG